MATLLDQIKDHKLSEIAALKDEYSLGDLEKRVRDLPATRDFRSALASKFGLIAEIKRKSPSLGEMRHHNIEELAELYDGSHSVNAVSVLTDFRYFGMSIDALKKVRAITSKPILRKDFILKDHQVFESRIGGADAILLMASLLDQASLKRLFELATRLGLHVLFEAHSEDEIARLPKGALICGINSRKFKTEIGSWRGWHTWASVMQRVSWLQSKKNVKKDLSTDLSAFDLVSKLPKQSIKVAESGIKPEKVKEVRSLGFDAMLVGTSLLNSTAQPKEILEAFEKQISPRSEQERRPILEPAFA